jgi:Uma2 family endonuclease
MSTTEQTTQAATSAPTTPLRMSFEEWMAWDHECGLTEWVDGEVIVMGTPSTLHQELVKLFGYLIETLVKVLGSGRMLMAPVGMRIISTPSVREPDLVYASGEHAAQFSDRLLEGPADLVIEVISDESATRDRSDKFYEYQAGGVREYWIIDPREGKQRVDLYILGDDGRYQPVPPELGGVYRSAVLPGFWIREAWLWQEQPNSLVIAGEMIGAERMLQALQRPGAA